MRLTKYTDYALRVLLFLAAEPGKLASVGEIARSYRISQNHLMKVVHNLSKAGYVSTVRGRFGGMHLARAAEDINIGAVVRHFEDGFELANCGACVIAPACRLTGVLHEAVVAFLGVIDKYTLADLVTKRGPALVSIFEQAAAEPPVLIDDDMDD